MLSAISISAERRTRLLEAASIFVLATAVAGFVFRLQAGLLTVVGCTVLWFAAAVVGDVFRGRIDRMLLCWAAFFPLGYFAMFPRQRAILTLEREVILVAFMGLLFVKRSTLTATPRPLRWAALACLAFIAVAGASLRDAPDFLNPARSLFDGFLLPVLFGWCVIAWFEVRRRLPAIHTAVCISSVICATIAAAEIVTGADLLPLGNSAMFYAGGIARPNGPFASNDALALVGALSFFLLLFLRAALGPKVGAPRTLLHSVGLAAAIGMALMPMFRSVALALLLALMIDTFWEKKITRRAWRVALILAFVGLVFSLSIFVPGMFEDRSNTANVYGRVAEYEQSLRVFTDHPLLGVGFSNFHNVVLQEPRYLTSYDGVSSLDWPHSNVAQVLAETGILGFVPYLMIHVLLFTAMWQLCRMSRSGTLVGKYYVYVFLAYWIAGLTESSGFDFANIWYAFAITVPYKYVLTEPDFTPLEGAYIPDEAFSAPARISSLRFSDDPTI